MKGPADRILVIEWVSFNRHKTVALKDRGGNSMLDVLCVDIKCWLFRSSKVCAAMAVSGKPLNVMKIHVASYP